MLRSDHLPAYGYRFDGSKAPTLARILRGNGDRTGAAVSSYVLRAETGISDGFELYGDTVAITPGGATSDYQRSGENTVVRHSTRERASRPNRCARSELELFPMPLRLRAIARCHIGVAELLVHL